MRSALFSSLPHGVGEGYRYRLGLGSDGGEAMPPELSIVLFDQAGIEVGRFELAGRAATSSASARALPSDGGRSYSGVLRGTGVAEARFFRIEQGPAPGALK